MTPESKKRYAPTQTMRRPPAFQCYASDTLTDENYRMASLAERGLMMTMKMQAWVSGSLPADQEQLAALLGVPVTAIRDNLTERVLAPFEATSAGRLVCPELDQLRDQYSRRHQERSDSGKRGADARYGRNQKPDGSAIAQPQPVAIAAPEVSGAEVSGGKLKKSESLRNGRIVNPFPLPDADEAAYVDAFRHVDENHDGIDDDAVEV